MSDAKHLPAVWLCPPGRSRRSDQLQIHRFGGFRQHGIREHFRHTDAEIKQAAAKVFLWEGYQQVNPLTFEKQGTSWDKMAYGGWSGNPVWIRMRINITPGEAGQTILACDAYAVVDRGEGSMEEEKKLFTSYRSDCKKILDETKVRLDSPPDGGAQ